MAPEQISVDLMEYGPKKDDVIIGKVGPSKARTIWWLWYLAHLIHLEV